MTVYPKCIHAQFLAEKRLLPYSLKVDGAFVTQVELERFFVSGWGKNGGGSIKGLISRVVDSRGHGKGVVFVLRRHSRFGVVVPVRELVRGLINYANGHPGSNWQWRHLLRVYRALKRVHRERTERSTKRRLASVKWNASVKNHVLLSW